ncbi:AraC family transcriptional regulator [Actinospica robiniae]|uniref:AraC family transcriptional regulator n=1 Tax=Actinospica robiniae TaxID=304901 RepID=UPI000685CDEE|nr:AraC family transcriptional regulator [Actinospica robiniae]
MDVLAGALAAMSVGPARSARTEVHAPWGLRFREVGGSTFHVVLAGGCWLLPDAAGAPLRLETGDVVFLRHGSAHGLADDPATPLRDFAPAGWQPGTMIGSVEIAGSGPRALLLCGAYQLGRARPHPLLRDLPELLHLPAAQVRSRGLPGAVELLGSELEQQRPGRDGIVPALVDAMLLLILRTWFEVRAGDERPTGWAAAIDDPAVFGALADLHERCERPWTVAELADRAGMSRSAFAHRFTALVGIPPLAYLTWWRMTAAGRLLQESDVPLSAVARQVGYTSEFAFAKAFRREYGLAPGRFRRSAGEGQGAGVAAGKSAMGQ